MKAKPQHNRPFRWAFALSVLLLGCGTPEDASNDAAAQQGTPADDAMLGSASEFAQADGANGDTAGSATATEEAGDGAGASESLADLAAEQGPGSASVADDASSSLADGAVEAESEVVAGGEGPATASSPMAASTPVDDGEVGGSESSESTENGQTGSAKPDAPCEPPPRTFCDDTSDCEEGQVCDVARDWELACDVSFADKTCDEPCEAGDCPDFHECSDEGRCELTSCAEGSTPCPGIFVCDPDSVDLAGSGTPVTRAGCIHVLCDHPEGPACSATETCDPSACSCVESEVSTRCSCEPGGDLLTGCRDLPCDDPAVTCPDNTTCEPGHERANDIGCVPARCDLGEVECSELFEPTSICKPECGSRFGCVTPKDDTDECGQPLPGPDQL